MRIDELVNDDDFKNMKAGQYIHGPIVDRSRIQSTVSNVAVEDLVSFIKNKCSDFVNQVNVFDLPLWRGVPWSTHKAQYFLGKTVDSREPLNTDPQIQQSIDDKLNKAGFKALRGNSIYCSNYLVEAEGYGKVYHIFPINGFDFTWNVKYADLTPSLQIARSWVAAYNVDQRDGNQNSDKFEILSNLLNDLEHLSPKQFVKVYGFSNQNLGKAIKSNHEVYIHGLYLAVSRHYMQMNHVKFKELLYGAK